LKQIAPLADLVRQQAAALNLTQPNPAPLF